MKTRSRAVLLAFLLALVAFELAVIGFGDSPLPIAKLLIVGTWGSRYGIGQVLFKATSIALAGIAARIALRAGLFHIGIEGTMAVSAITVGIVGARLPISISPFVAWPLLATVGVVAGGLWSLPVGVLRARFGGHEVISGIMLNRIASSFVGYLLAKGFAERASVHTPPMPRGATLARLPWFPGAAVNVAILVAIVAVVGWSFVARRTVLGRNFAVVGASPSAAEGAGLSVSRLQILSLTVAGMVAGLTALNDVMGYKGYAEEGLSAGVGFTGLAAALLAGDSTIGFFAAVLFFATLSQGGLSINTRVPMEIVDVLVAAIILLVAVSPRIERAILAAKGSDGREGR